MCLTSLKLRVLALAIFVSCLSLGATTVPAQQKMDSLTRERMLGMLKTIKGAIKADYYDPKFGGVDLDAHFAAAEKTLKSVDTLSQAYIVIGKAVIDLNDSHTLFWPPSRNTVVEYGWKMKMVGDKAFITGVAEKSDAQLKGLAIGDEVLKLNGIVPVRGELWKMMYFYQELSPQTKVWLEIRKPDGQLRQLEINTKVTAHKRRFDFYNSGDLAKAVVEGERAENEYKSYFKTVGTAVIWKMPTFAIDPADLGRHMDEVKGKETLILDLRGNSGGYVVTLEKLAGYFLPKDTKIADFKGRKKMDPQVAKGSGSFSGKLIVLLDSESASASEVFARVMQIEKRATVVGDVSAGMVMMSKGVSLNAGSGTSIFGDQTGTDISIPYGLNLTRADVIMTDGKSLERVGVKPDEIIIPTASDLATRRDPVLARALSLVGINMDADAAGKLMPVEKFYERKYTILVFWI
jgi:C-terminal processing protease CtpA/Prc